MNHTPHTFLDMHNSSPAWSDALQAVRMRIRESMKETLISDLETNFRSQNRGRRLQSLLNKPRTRHRVSSPEMKRLDNHSASLFDLIQRNWNKFLPASVQLHSESPLNSVTHVPSPELFLQLLTTYTELEARIDNQILLEKSTNRIADQLSETVEELLHSSKIHPRNLKRTIGLVSDADAIFRKSEDLFSEPGLLLENLISSRSCPIDAEVFGRGIQTARIIARTVPQFWFWKDHYAPLMAAALLQDVGLMISPQTRQQTYKQVEQQSPHIFEKHPQLGASLFSGIDQWSVICPRLIARHHAVSKSRPTGKWQQRSLDRYEQILVVAVRYSELIRSASIENQVKEQTASNRIPQDLINQTTILERAALQLMEETASGMIDATVAKAILGTLGISTTPEYGLTDHSDGTHRRNDSAHGEFHPRTQHQSASSRSSIKRSA